MAVVVKKVPPLVTLLRLMTSSPHSQPVEAVRWKDGSCFLLDQTALPHVERYVRCETFAQVVGCIRTLSVRGAPAIGVAGAYGVVLAAKQALSLPENQRVAFVEEALGNLAQARPTAVNLRWATERMRRAWSQEGVTANTVEKLLRESLKIHAEDAEANARIAALGAEVLPPGEILTYCNTGSLATGGHGTALGVVQEAFRRGKVTHVYACETRPLLQGLRLTAWELQRMGIPYSVICDNTAATILRSRPVSAVIVGADRIARNGDTANKIGTYGLAILARHHRIPFYVAAPLSTFDGKAATGEDIPIEERAAEEILAILGDGEFAPNVCNPSFDVTPHELITGIVFETGVVSPPYLEKLSHPRQEGHA